MQEINGLSRREFVRNTLAAGAALSALSVPRVHAAGGQGLKIALIGCGGRGNGALENCLSAGKHLGLELTVVATADVSRERAVEAGAKHGVPEERCFDGFNGYKHLLEAGPDVVLMATPPIFRPLHLDAAVAAGKHVFMEKPVAVDPPGARQIIAAGDAAAGKNLVIVAGTQRRHQAGYRQQAYALENGDLGEILGGTVAWLGGRLWYKTRNPGEDDASYMTRNWVSFVEMSGDHIVEQHVHNIDIANWFLGTPPVAAIGFGGRARRETGNQFDFFSVDFTYADGVHIHSMCRQVNGCYGRVGEIFRTTKGTLLGGGKFKAADGGTLDIAQEFPEYEGPYVQEHVDLLDSIVKGTPLNEARAVAESTMAGIMGRISAYTGQLVRWSDVMQNEKSEYYNLTLSPSAADFEKGAVTAPPDDVIPVPGKA